MSGVLGKYPRPPLRPARDQGRRRGARALALPDDPHRGQEARPARVRRGAREERHDARASARLPGRAPEDEARDLQGAPHGLRRDRPRTWSCTWRRRPANEAHRHGRRLHHGARPSWSRTGSVLWQDYQRHNTRQAEKVLEFLGRMEEEAQVVAGRDRVFFTGSGAGLLGPLVGRQDDPGGGRGRRVRRAAAPGRALRVRDRRRGHEDDLLHRRPATGRSKQVYMQSACSGGTGTFIEKTARKLAGGERAARRRCPTRA